MTSKVSFIFGPVETEIAAKLDDTLHGPARPEKELLKSSTERLGPEATVSMQKALFFAKSLQSKDPTHRSFEVYFSHPVRVASFVLRMQAAPKFETVLIALLHNLYELTGMTETDVIRECYSDRMSKAIRLLTIDRLQERNPEYLKRFYGQIEAFGPDLSLIRCVDKLDNIMELELIADKDVYSSYLDLAETFVQPMAQRLTPEFGAYFAQVIAALRKRSFQPELRKRYDALVGAHLKEASRT